MPSPGLGLGLVVGGVIGACMTIAALKHRSLYRLWRKHIRRAKVSRWLPPIPVVEAQEFVRRGYVVPRTGYVVHRLADGLVVTESPLEEAKYVRPRVRCESGHPGARAVRRVAYQVVGRAA